jgi:hypothetical protein
MSLIILDIVHINNLLDGVSAASMTWLALYRRTPEFLSNKPEPHLLRSTLFETWRGAIEQRTQLICVSRWRQVNLVYGGSELLEQYNLYITDLLCRSFPISVTTVSSKSGLPSAT